MSYTSTKDSTSTCRLLYDLPHSVQIISILILLLSTSSMISSCSAKPTKWVGTWSTAPQLVEQHNNPPSPGLSHNTLRQIVHVSLGGDTLRMRFSNEFSNSPVTLKEVHLAVSKGGGVIDETTDRALYFDGETEITMEPGSAVTSDAFQFPLQPLTDVAITIYFGDTSPDVTGHPGSRTTSYLLTGNEVARIDFSGAVQTDHWYVINSIDVKAPDSSAAVVILGNSIADGRGSGTNKQNRWPDELARRLHANQNTGHVAVLNQGIGGNCVLGSCLGPSALSRFERDVLGQSSAKWLVILEGINDIGYSWGTGVANDLINAYTRMINSAHANGIFVYGATLLPMKGSSYYSGDHEQARQGVNEWIRNSGYFDAVIDFDMALRNPEDTLSLRPEADTGDHLHPNETGHRMMAEAIDLDLFTGSDSVVYTDDSWSVYFEPECATVGEHWDILMDSQASNGRYVTVKSGIESLSEAPAGRESFIIIPFSVDSLRNYSVFARLNCPTANDDSYWVKMDDGEFTMHNGLGTSGWEWLKYSDYLLSAGEHTLTIAYREDGAKLDKICISDCPYAPLGLGEEAENICGPTGVSNLEQMPDAYVLEQNYPNPFNPTTSIKYCLAQKSKVTLEVFDMTGRMVETLINGVAGMGEHTITFNGSDLASGIYFYRLRTSTGVMRSKKMAMIK
ncbi:T9SS type A sorting domain-containing protein [candidate division KSB1 bacterium]|nr:T9SS type A sorting domain-containing protein [candidate division KSB1 bacterium]